jgi:hypothetical protein
MVLGYVFHFIQIVSFGFVSYKFVSMPRSSSMVQLRSMFEFTFKIALKQKIKTMKQDEQC